MVLKGHWGKFYFSLRYLWDNFLSKSVPLGLMISFEPLDVCQLPSSFSRRNHAAFGLSEFEYEGVDA